MHHWFDELGLLNRRGKWNNSFVRALIPLESGKMVFVGAFLGNIAFESPWKETVHIKLDTKSIYGRKGVPVCALREETR